MSHQQQFPPSRRLIAGDAAGRQTNTTDPTLGGADREELDDRAAQMDRGVATAEPHALYGAREGYPPLCVHGMNPFTDEDYGPALARLRRG